MNKGSSDDRVTEEGSGRMKSPGKSFYPGLVAEVITVVTNQVNSNGVSYARTYMLHFGWSVNVNGNWKEGQLNGDLQVTSARHSAHFNGDPVHPWDGETASPTDEQGDG